MRILVAYGSKMGGTAGIAEMVAEGLRGKGRDVALRPAVPTRDLDTFDAVIVGGALYSLRWHKASKRFVKQHAATLRSKSVYLFSSGPLDDSAAEAEIPPTRGVAKLMALVGARGHATFGGRMPADAKGFPAAAMARDNAGDWRDPQQVAAWVEKIHHELASIEAAH